MRRTEWLQETRRMRFEDALQGWTESRLTQEEAAQLLGVCARTFRRYIDRYEENGLDGLIDKRLSQASHRRAPVDEVLRLVDRYRSRHRGWNVRHFYSWYRRDGGQRSYTFVACPDPGVLDAILCAHHQRVVGGDNCVRFQGRVLQIPADRHRRHYVKAKVKVFDHGDGTLSVWHGPRELARYDADGNLRLEELPAAA